jgi:ribosomal protein L37AE/L43A
VGVVRTGLGAEYVVQHVPAHGGRWDTLNGVTQADVYGDNGKFGPLAGRQGAAVSEQPFRPNTGKPSARHCEECGRKSPAAISYYRQTVPGRWLCFKCVTKIQRAAKGLR